MTNNICDFLIIGAMKAGTTTLYKDLQIQPFIYLPPSKEPEVLVKNSSYEDIKKSYERLFTKAESNQYRGEASTAYTKMPDICGVAERARSVLGSKVKLIYMTRDPVERAISHYRHDFVSKVHSLDIEDALVSRPQYIDYSRYDFQLRPWLECFGFESVMVIRFEDYISDRATYLKNVCSFLGADSQLVIAPEDVVHNSSTHKYVETGVVRKLLALDVYQRYLKVVLPSPVTQYLKKLILNKARPSQSSIPTELRSHIVECLNESER